MMAPISFAKKGRLPLFLCEDFWINGSRESASGQESKSLPPSFNLYVAEAGCLEPGRHRRRIHKDHGVEDVKQTHPQRPQAVRSDKCSSRPQHSVHFSKEPVLQRG